MASKKMPCDATMLKGCTFMLNFFIFLGGLMLTYVGGFQLYYQQFSYGQLLLLDETIPTIDIVVGCVLILTSFFGFNVILNDKYVMIYAYGVLIALMVIVQFAAAALTLDKRKKMYDDIYNGLIGANLLALNDPVVQKLLHDMQQSVQCCAVNGPNDFRKPCNPLKPCLPLVVPQSCKDANNKTFMAGCGRAFADEMRDQVIWIPAMSYVFCLTQIASTIVSIWWAVKIQTQKPARFSPSDVTKAGHETASLEVS